MPEHDRDLLIEAAKTAGEIASDFAQRPHEKWDKPDGAGPVTEADLAVNNFLEVELRNARPDYGWLSEESDDSNERLGKERLFIIDPIDGTRSFIEGSKTWAHSFAVVENGDVTAAVVYLPLLDKLYAAAKGKGATLNGEAISASSRQGLVGAEMLATKPIYKPEHWKNGTVPDLIRAYRPSLAYRLALVAEGRYDAMLTLRPSWEWDIAAGALLLSEAGGAISDRQGKPLKFNNADPRLNGVVAAGSGVHSALQACLK
ncbi:3'(2'),5'-bisphosphate nucleotidase CysQ [Lentibacter algarum]|uniref:3'(2'),5'-bisphosphate nucleotidase CysQ n=1 Tax=Lentibacter algarum TaxID=576131 RepID=UPI002090380F|nr:3'(2'),5'-bisphosphate nucleotidase CysQ [Lentibacter algarum]